MAHDDHSTSNGHGERGGEKPSGPRWLDRIKTLLRLKQAPTLRDEIEGALADDAGTAEPDFSPEERAMLKNVLTLREQNVGDVMVPRADIVAVPGEVPLVEVLTTFEEAEHSRLPVYGETIDDLKGMVHIKDVMRYLTTRGRTGSGLDLGRADLAISTTDAGLVREVLYVPPSMPAASLLAKMQASHIHMALVIDEYGGTDGLVTIENLVEMVVGDIADEHDEVEGPTIIRARDTSLIAQGRTPLDELEEALGEGTNLGETAEEVDTLGGLMVTLAGRVPVRGEIIAGPDDLDFEVLDADPRRVKRVRVRRRPRAVADAEPANGAG
jgi:CBS domain containing-hemolysin-like protein